MSSLNHAAIQLALRTKLVSLSINATTPFARSTTGTYTDINGVLQTAGINVLRNANYLSGVLQPILIESAVTNIALRSQEFDNAAYTNVGTPVVTANTTVAPDGTTTADTLDDQSAATISGRRQMIAVAANTNSYCMSVYVLKTVGTPDHFPIINPRLTGGVTVDFNAVLNTTTGAVATLGTGTAGAIDAGTYWRFYASITNGGANTSLLASTYSAGSATFSATLSAGGVGTNVFWGLQVEVGTIPTSYIGTTTVAVTRGADVDIMLAATTTGYTRVTGSFITDGFAIGQEITPTGFSANTVDTITAITATTLTVVNTRSVETALAGRALAVLLPSFAWENVKFIPTTGRPYIEEQFLPGPTSLNSFGANGDITAEPTYVLNVYTPSDSGFLGGAKYVDSIMSLFCPSTSMALTTGDTLFVRADTGPYRGQVRQVDGWACIPITIPLRVYTSNAL